MKNKDHGIAVIGMACRYPDIANFEELWENVLAQRRAFRVFPESRLSADYFSADDPDKVYARMAAVISGYVFDRAKYGISGKNFRAADLTHWLALDMASLALEQSGLMNLQPDFKESTGVYVGNTLTGEFSRANLMRLRWPFVRKKVLSQLINMTWTEGETERFLTGLEADYKSSFPVMSEDSLAGGLSNTIAGRICNYHDFHGGGYTVDGACSSSLLAVIEACKNIASGDHSVALAGGVDLSLDPFEMVGFSRAAALAKQEMLIYDKASNGFWPGEGCGFVVLADVDFAHKHHLPVYAIIKGYGVSSDGQGGLTRPAVSGQLLAMQRAYAKAGYPSSTVHYFEGHGTGTEVGDAVELQTIISSLNEKTARQSSHYIGSIKGNIGHTKAAAGIAGLLKSIAVLMHRLIPPITACKNPHPLLQNGPLHIPFQQINYSGVEPMRAAVSAMGFGGINTHITLEESTTWQPVQQARINSSWQTWPFIFEAECRPAILKELERVNRYASQLSMADLPDLSNSLRTNQIRGNHRAVIIASSPQELSDKLLLLIESISAGKDFVHQKETLFYAGNAKTRIGFLFPGQGTPSVRKKGNLSHQFPWLTLPTNLPDQSGLTEQLSIAQPSIVATSLLSASILEQLGITAQIGVGHSLGEIAALAWSGVLSEADAMVLASKRGELMSSSPQTAGLMLGIASAAQVVTSYLQGTDLAIAAINSSKHTVVSGRANEVEQLRDKLKAACISTVLLPVKYAFHSPRMKVLVQDFSKTLNLLQWHAPHLPFVSTVTAKIETQTAQIKHNLEQQLSAPVLFLDSIKAAELQVDLWIDLGGDQTMAQIVKNINQQPVGSMAIASNPIGGLLSSLALIWVYGNTINWDKLFEGAFSRSFNLNYKPGFFVNPCEMDVYVVADDAPLKLTALPNTSTLIHTDRPLPSKSMLLNTAHEKQQELPTIRGYDALLTAFKVMIANKLELSVHYLQSEFRFLDDLHLNSLEVAQLIAEFALSQSIVIRGVLTEYANASIAEVAAVLESNASLSAAEQNTSLERAIPGILPWVHYFSITQQEEHLITSHDSPLWKSSSEAQPLYNSEGRWHLIQKNGAENGFHEDDVRMLSGTGCLLNLQETDNDTCLSLLDGLLQLLKLHPNVLNLIVLQDQFKSGGMLKSIFLESNQYNILCITSDLKVGIPILQAEFKQCTGFKELVFKNDKRLRPFFKPLLLLPAQGNAGLSAKDVVLITGGAKGITAECALALASKYSLTVILVGRADPVLDSNLKNNLQRFASAGLKWKYYQADIAVQEQAAQLILSIIHEFGTITAFIHGAGLNHPISWQKLSLSEISATCSPKVQGFRNIISAMQNAAANAIGNLKMLLSFGSIIAESGMSGNADYALANEWLKNEVLNFAALHPHCNCLNVEWSVWSGAGMGEQLGVLEQLMADGIQPIDLDQGVRLFNSWMEDFPAEQNIIVSGRYGSKSTLWVPEPDLPLRRYLENVRLFYPDLEIISDVELSEQQDLYLTDHKIGNEHVFPAVMGLEAMQQVAAAICKKGDQYIFNDARFTYPITLAGGKKITIRILAARLDEQRIKVTIRCSSTDFCQDHFEAWLVKDQQLESHAVPPSTVLPVPVSAPELDVEKDLYGNLLFHTGMFKILLGYTALSAYHCIAEARPLQNTRYFNDFLSAEILSLEPALRDAALHCVQACVPEYRILPIAFKKLLRYSSELHSNLFKIEAIEVSKKDKIYTFDLYISTEHNQLIEYWEGVQFKVLSDQPRLQLPLVLLTNIMQRRVDELDKSGLNFKMITDPAFFETVMQRYDGKPLLNNLYTSKTHMAAVAVQVLAERRIGCDLEQVSSKSALLWQSILGNERFQLAAFVSSVAAEPLDLAATRIWGVKESIKKAGINITDTLLLSDKLSPYLQYFKCGSHTILSLAFWSAESQCQAVFTLVIAEEFNIINHETI